MGRPRDTGRHSARPDPAPPAADTRGSDPPVPDDDESGILAERLYLQARRRPRRLSRLPRLIGEATGLVWSTSRWGTVNVVAVQFLSAGVAAAQVALGGYALDRLLSGGDEVDIAAVLPPLLLLAVVTTIGALGTGGMSQLGRLLGLRVQRTVQARVLDVTTSVDLVAYDDPVFHDQLQRVTTNAPSQPYAVVSSVASLVGGLVGAVSLVVTLFVIQPLLIVVLVLAAPVLWQFSRRGGDIEFDFAAAQAEAYRERDYLSDVLSRREGAGEVRAYGTGPRLRRRWDDSYDEFLVAMRRHVRRRYSLNAATVAATGVVTVATLVVLVRLVAVHAVGVGEAGSAAVAIRLLAGRLQQLAAGLTSLFEASVFLDDFAGFLARAGDARLRRRPPAVEPVDGASRHAPLRGLRVRDAHFRYPNGSHDAVDGVSLDLRSGEVVALVGENGSGKTTLAKLLAGLYRPSAGRVTWWDGTTEHDLAGADGRPARDRIGLVLQDFTRYQLTAAENIAFGRPELDPDRERIERSADHVGAAGFVADLPRGYDTRLSRQFRGGRELSDGQWQRIALARVFYRDADLVILDEPTAALDPRAEYRLFESLRAVLGGRAVLFVTHRLASVRGADRIVVMADGRITEEGDHDTLMAAGGLYAELVTLQSRGGLTV